MKSVSEWKIWGWGALVLMSMLVVYTTVNDPDDWPLVFWSYVGTIAAERVRKLYEESDASNRR